MLEELLLGGHLREEDGLQHEIAEFFGKFLPVAASMASSTS